MIPGLLIYGVLSDPGFRSSSPNRPTSRSGPRRRRHCLACFVFFNGPFAAFSVETFPVHVRSTGASIVYNFGVAIFGGLSPLITAKLVQATDNKMAPFFSGGCLILR